LLQNSKLLALKRKLATAVSRAGGSPEFMPARQFGRAVEQRSVRRPAPDLDVEFFPRIGYQDAQDIHFFYFTIARILGRRTTPVNADSAG
jgi:hypothetical protein